ncbi:MAG: hypothetical protein ACRDLZ_08160 [Gaiellaceae bacterium]
MSSLTTEEPGWWRFEIAGGHKRLDEQGRWLVILRVEATSDREAAETHYATFYELVVDGTPYKPSCFDVVGGAQAPAPGQSSEALVGFELPAEPAGPLSLDLYASGIAGRIDMASG